MFSFFEYILNTLKHLEIIKERAIIYSVMD